MDSTVSICTGDFRFKMNINMIVCVANVVVNLSTLFIYYLTKDFDNLTNQQFVNYRIQVVNYGNFGF